MRAGATTYFRTARLVARSFVRADAEPFAAYRADPEVARYQGWSDYTLERASAFVESLRGVPPGVPGEWFQIGLESRADGVLVGDLALHVDREEPRLAEVGFTLAPDQQGKGFATEALTAYLDWLFAGFDLHRVFAVTDALNAPAAALLERVGFRREAHFVENVFFKGAWGSELLFAVLEREWAEKTAPG
jgi:RimJ/RimL family protein N-acetyltransferase